MSVRVAAARDVGGFDSRQGPGPGVAFDRGEEEELQRRLALAGWQIWYEPRAAIDHIVPRERLTVESFVASARNRGLAAAARRRPRWSALPQLARSSARFVVLRLRRDPLAVTARFTWIEAWTLLTARRSRLPRLPGEL